jgi:hypothetical protein
MVRYEHPALDELKYNGIFTVHVVHGRNREMVRRTNFRNFTYPVLIAIVDYMRKEGLCER